MRVFTMVALAILLAGCDGGDLPLEPALPILEESLLQRQEEAELLAQIKTKRDLERLRPQLRKTGARHRRIDQYMAAMTAEQHNNNSPSEAYQKAVFENVAKYNAEQRRIADTLGPETMAAVYKVINETRFPQPAEKK